MSHQYQVSIAGKLVAALDVILNERRGVVTELELLKTLQKPPFSLLAEKPFDSDISLFHTHFVLYHALYQLRDVWHTQQVALVDIGLSKLEISDFTVDASRCLDTTHLNLTDPLRDYYLDWKNLSTTEDELEHLLSSFWKRLTGVNNINDDLDNAYACLAVNANDDEHTVRKRYKKLAFDAHPDRGGDNELFVSIKLAWKTIKLHRGW